MVLQIERLRCKLIMPGGNMLCPACNRTNDADATFCAECGRPIVNEPAAKPFRSRRIYLFALFLVPVLIGVAALGYYRFFLPDG